MKKTILAAAAFASLAAAGLNAFADDAPSPFTGNLSVVSDYRFRGLSQTFRQPAVQGGFDYVHPSGLYVGNWNSNVSGNQYLNGGSLEMDFYGGYRFEPVKDVGLDLGALYYYYPGAKYNNGERYNNGEIYLGGTWKWFSAKYSYGVTDFFGTNSGTGYAPNGNSKGSGYLDLNFNYEIVPKTTLTLHAGHQTVRHYGRLNYSDYKVGVARDFGFATVGLAVVGTDADKALYTVGDNTGRTRDIGSTTAVLSIGKTF